MQAWPFIFRKEVTTHRVPNVEVYSLRVGKSVTDRIARPDRHYSPGCTVYLETQRSYEKLLVENREFLSFYYYGSGWTTVIVSFIPRLHDTIGCREPVEKPVRQSVVSCKRGLSDRFGIVFSDVQ